MLGYTGPVFRSRLSGYVLRETLPVYLLGIAAFCLLLSIDFLSTLAQFLIQYQASAATVGKLLLYRLPYFLHLSLPIALVFATLLATGRLAKDSELKAAYAAGVPPLSLLGPLVLFGLLVSGLALYNNGYLEPLGQSAYTDTVNSFFYGSLPPQSQLNVAYSVKGEGVFYASRIQADRDNHDLAHLQGVLVIRPDGTLISSEEGLWKSREHSWLLTQPTILKTGQAPSTQAQLSLPFQEQTQVSSSLADPEQQTLSQLRAHIGSAAAAGGETRELRFNFQRRIADAFDALIFVLLAGALGLGVRGRSGGFGWTIVLLVLFYFIWTLSQNLFQQQVLSPVVAAWFTTVVVGFIGGTLALVRFRA